MLQLALRRYFVSTSGSKARALIGSGSRSAPAQQRRHCLSAMVKVVGKTSFAYSA